MRLTQKIIALTGATGLMIGLAGCHIDMWRQPKARYQQQSTFFADGVSDRLPVVNTIARGQVKDDEGYFTGYVGGNKYGTAITVIPTRTLMAFPGENTQERTRAMLLRGQGRFNIYCTPCHGKIGDGNGMIAQRGFALRRPPGNYHTKRLREMPLGHFYDVIVNGYGSMYSYASRVQEVDDRWAIVAYIRALQLSQNATAADLTPADKAKLDAAPAAATGSETMEK